MPIISASYDSSPYTRRELQAAQDRALHERREYILPLRLDDTDLSGFLAGDSYVDLRTSSVDQVCDLLVEKLDSLGSD